MAINANRSMQSSEKQFEPIGVDTVLLLPLSLWPAIHPGYIKDMLQLP